MICTGDYNSLQHTLHFFEIYWETLYFLTWQHIRRFNEVGHSFYYTNFVLVCNRTG